MKIARATDKDLEYAYRICNIVNQLNDGYYPSLEDDEDDPTFFDESDPDHLKKLYDLISVIKAGSLYRVVGNAAAVLNETNKIIDLESDTLALHPRIANVLKQQYGEPVNENLKAYWCDEYCIYAAESKEEAARLYNEDTGCECEDEYPYECSDDVLDEPVDNFDEDERPTGTKTSIRKWLETMTESGWLCGMD